MMRYQRISPDCVPLSNGKKSNLIRTAMCKEDDASAAAAAAAAENGRVILTGYTSTVSTTSTSPGFEGKGIRFRSSPSETQDGGGGGGVPSSPQSENNNNHQSQRYDNSPSPSPSRSDVLLQWGQKKRSRVSRVVVVADESSSSLSVQAAINLQRRVSTTMPPPPPPSPLPSSFTPNTSLNNNSSSTARNITTKDTFSFLPKRNLEERSGGGNGSPSRNSGARSQVVSRSTAGKRSPPFPERIDRKVSCSGSAKDVKPNGSLVQSHRHINHGDSAPLQSEHEAGADNTMTPPTGGEKVNVEVFEWPRIYLALSRKEKEDDFLAMKGTKLPQRPKKRPKTIDKSLQYCFPGMWLSDLTRSRYEVREKKSVKKQKRRGLKGMETMDSDSE